MRGDIAYGNEEMMAKCERRGLVYLFKPRQMQRSAQRIGKRARQEKEGVCRNAGQDRERTGHELQSHGWKLWLNDGTAGDRAAAQARWPAPGEARYGATLVTRSAAGKKARVIPARRTDDQLGRKPVR